MEEKDHQLALEIEKYPIVNTKEDVRLSKLFNAALSENSAVNKSKVEKEIMTEILDNLRKYADNELEKDEWKFE